MLSFAMPERNGATNGARPSGGLRPLVFALLVGGCLVADQAIKSVAVERLSVEAPVGGAACGPSQVPGERAHSREPTRTIRLLADHCELRYVENCGSTFGWMAEWPVPLKWTVFVVLGLGGVLMLLLLQTSARSGTVGGVGLALLAGGTLGNLVDRVVLGYVVDYVRCGGRLPQLLAIDVQLFGHYLRRGPFWSTPAVNLADLFILLGALAFALSYVRARRASERRS